MEKETNKKVIVIGAGVAGLSAGIHALQSGFDVTIYEQHNIPGGNSTSWKREAYLFEGAMHWVTGSGPNKALHKLWRNVGVINDDTKMYFQKQYFSLNYKGQQVSFYRNLAEFQKHLLEISREDEKAIALLCKEIKMFSVFDMPITDIKGVKVKEKEKSSLSSLLAMLPALSKMKKYNNMSVSEYVTAFKSPAIRAFLENCLGKDIIAFNLLVTLGQLASEDGAYIEGGSLALAFNMEKRFVSLGGTICYNQKVDKVLVEKQEVSGVVVQGKEVSCLAVIVASDTISAVDGLFDQALIDDQWILQMKENTKDRIMACTFISLGLQVDLSEYPSSLSFFLDQPFKYADTEVSALGFHQYSAYPEYAPKGCTAMTVVLMGDTYDYWLALKKQGSYEQEKKRLAQEVITILTEKLPVIKDKIAVIDVATPLTYQRYCNTYRGGWMNNMKKGDKMTNYPQVSKSVKHLYFAGQRMMTPGGLPVALFTGRQAVQYLCKNSDIVFQAKL